MKKGFGELGGHSTLKKDYGSILTSVDPMILLDFYGAKNIFDDGGEWIKHSCLIDRVDSHHLHGDMNPSAALNRKNLSYNCFSYHDNNGKSGGDIWWFLHKMENDDESAIRKVLLKLYDPQVLNKKITTQEMILDNLKKAKDRNSIYKKVFTSFSPETVKRFKSYHPVYQDRGISESVANRYDLGWDPKLNELVLPHMFDGKLIGWQKRIQEDPRWDLTPKDEMHQKYKFSSDFPKVDTLWNLDTVKERKSSSVTLVESVFSVLKAETFFEQTDNHIFQDFVSTFSAHLSEDQAKLLDQFDTVNLLFDMDIAGITASLKAYDMLKSTHTVKWVFLKSHKDFDEIIDAQEAQKALTNKLSSINGYLLAKDIINNEKEKRRKSKP